MTKLLPVSSVPTPGTRKGAARLGWAIFGSIVLFVLYLIVVPPGWPALFVALLAVLIYSGYDSDLYNWVTRPERDESLAEQTKDDLTNKTLL